jgi:hypothetical protein
LFVYLFCLRASSALGMYSGLIFSDLDISGYSEVMRKLSGRNLKTIIKRFLRQFIDIYIRKYIIRMPLNM